jgi:hypothetical protein
VAGRHGPDFERIADWLEGRLPAEEAAQVERLVAGDPVGMADAAWLRMFGAIRREVAYEAPPASVRAALIERFEARAPEPAVGFIGRVIARLTFDSFATAGALAVRGAGEDRQLVFSSDAGAVALAVRERADPSLVDIHGQVMPAGDLPPEAFAVELVASGRAEGATTGAAGPTAAVPAPAVGRVAVADELGEFVLAGVPRATWDVVLSAGSTEIVLASIDIGR